MVPLGKDPKSRSYTQYNVINRVEGNVANTILQLRANGQEGMVSHQVSYANRDALPNEPMTRWSDQVFQSWQEGKSAQLKLVMRRNIQNRHSDKVVI